MRHLLLWICCLPLAMKISAQDLPIDKQATPETIHLFHHLKSLSQKGFLFGHQDDLAYGVGWKDVPGRSDIKDVTGDYPGLYGWELGRIELDHPDNLDGVSFDKMRQYIQQGYRRGGVITISWHLNNPLTGGTAWQPAPGTVASVLPGGEKNALYTSWLDKVAAFLQSLQGDHGEPIPVILRLFHELNGNWFWWGGNHCTPDELRRLWRFTVTYLRDTRHLHNLLYAYNTDNFATPEAWLEKYPGDDWVDVAGFDTYQRNTNAAFASALDKMITMLETIGAQHNKIPALTEFGYNELPDSSWWTGTLLPVLQTHHLAYIMAWRNAGDEPGGHHEYYVPYSGQGSAADFVKFHASPRVLFQQAATSEKLYNKK